MVEQVADLLSEEGRDNGRRGFVCTETVVVGGAHHGSLEQSVVSVDSHQRLDDEDDEAQIVCRCLPCGMEKNAAVGTQTPVVVLA